jgi:aspartyl-tRNA(Asn)/glutamyl-tRNA(Gln) amidotransferase subunit C
MAKITQADVEYVAGLAQLTLDDATKERLVGEMGDILAYMDKLNELSTEGIEPMMHAMEMTNIYREDVVEPSLQRDQALANAPDNDGEYFLVPKILDTE